jgi:hypothetical protein
MHPGSYLKVTPPEPQSNFREGDGGWVQHVGRRARARFAFQRLAMGGSMYQGGGLKVPCSRVISKSICGARKQLPKGLSWVLVPADTCGGVLHLLISFIFASIFAASSGKN